MQSGKKTKTRDVTYRMWKRGAIVDVQFQGPTSFRKGATYEALDSSVIFGVDTESLKKGGTLKTVLTTLHFGDGQGVKIETVSGKTPLESLLDEVWKKGFHAKEERPSRTKTRERSGKAGKKTGGARQALPVALSVWFNLPYDFGRLVAGSEYVLRTVAAGADAYKFQLGAYEIEVLRMFFGSASAFTWVVRHAPTRTALKLMGIDMCGYWKASLAASAKAVGAQEKIDIESVIEDVYEKPFEEFTPEEWRLFCEYGMGDVKTHLELYHATVKLLQSIDARVVRSSGVVPPSAPGASSKIMFAKAFDLHPGIESWERYPAWADQLGCDAYFGGRVFRRRRGIFRGMTSFDLKSAYPYAMSLLPDPVTVFVKWVGAGEFRESEYRGKFGVLIISGESFDDLYPPFREHDEERRGRLRYVYGRFEKKTVTIPEIMIGVARGALRVDKVHGGCVMVGSNKTSFMRKAVLDYFAIKEDVSKEKALRDMAKLLANASYGKVVEVTEDEYLIIEKIVMPRYLEHEDVAKSLAACYANGTVDIEAGYWGKIDADRTRVRANDIFSMLSKKNSTRTKDSYQTAGVIAVESYLAAMALSEEPHDGSASVAQYLSEVRTYRAGSYFMPLYGSQITGVPCAMVGAMASCFRAYLGDTDSVHVFDDFEGKDFKEDARFRMYADIMTRAGYTPPEMKEWSDETNGKSVERKLGCWEKESVRGSVESVLTRTKLYSHKFVSGKGEVTFKQAHHGLPKFFTSEIAAASKGRAFSLVCTRETFEEVGDKETKIKRAKRVRETLLHEAIRDLCMLGEYDYETRPSPRKLVEATRQGLPVGEFISRPMSARVGEDPNTWIDEKGDTRWKRLDEVAK